MDQVFVVGKVCEKYVANGKDVFLVFIDSENASDMIYRHGLRQMIIVYGVGGKLMRAVQSFYVDSIGRVSGWEWMRVSGFRLRSD